MDREEILYLTPYFLSLTLTLGIFIYTWRHRHVRGAKIYSWFVGGQTLTILGFIFELISPNLPTKIFWDKFQWITDTFLVIIPFLIFSIQFSEHKLRYPRLTRAFWISLSILFTLILLTDDIHHLIYPDPRLSADQPFPDLTYSFTYVVYGYSLLFVYGANFWGIGLLIKRAFQPYNSYRFQFWTVALGFLIPVTLSIFAVANIKIAPQRDIAPFSIAIGNMVVAWGLFRHGLFDIIPIAREYIVENMVDPVIVLDVDNRVVDINPAAVKSLGKQVSGVLGKSTSDVFENWPVIARELETSDTEQKELVVQRDDDIFYFDLNISPIFNKRGRLLGKIAVARDVTRHKTLEAGYRTLSAELEQRVNERTEEVRKASEQYRAVVENQTEFIVRWKPDGTRTFVNDAYCRYFNISPKEALSTDFMPLIFEDDRKAVDEKILRLRSGVVRTETDTHRVIRPDGSIGWQEWTDQAICNESGELIEFQSVGRDVTRNKQAEMAMQKSELKHRLLFESANDSIFIMKDAQFIDCNSKTLEMFGCERGQIIGKTPIDFSPDTQPDGGLSETKAREKINSVLNGVPQFFEWQHSRLDDTLFDAEVSLSLLELDNETFIQAIVRDITERKQAEDALRKSEEKFSKAFQLSPIIIVISKIEQAMLVDVNEAFEKITGFRRHEAIGRSTLDLGIWGNPQDRESILSTINENGEFKNREIHFQARDGSPIIGLVSGELIELDGEKCVLSTVEDITERKKAEEDILRLNRLYVTISQINQTIVRLRDKNKLFSEICRVAIDHGQFRMAWIGLIDETGKYIEPATFAGAELGYLKNVRVDFHDKVLGSGPASMALPTAGATPSIGISATAFTPKG